MKALAGKDIADRIEAEVPGSVIESDEKSVLIDSRAAAGVMSFLNSSPDLGFDYLTSLTAVDYLEYFEMVYNLVSMTGKQTLTIKSRVYGRENPEIPSVSHIWRGADFQEREVYDLLGIRFMGHQNLKRIALWEGFEGHPLRKDVL